MATTRRRVPRSVRRVAAVLVVAAIIEFFVIPQWAGAREAAGILSGVGPFLLALGGLLEVASLCAYFQLTRSLLPAEQRPSLARMARVELATKAVSNVIPGGTAPATALGYRLLTEAGVRPTDAGFALATQGLGSAVVLNAIFWVALIVSIPMRGIRPLYTAAAVLGVVVFGLFTVLVVGLTRAEGRTADVMCRVASRLPFLECARVEQGVHRVAARLRELSAQPRLVVRAVVWAAANWLLSAASLWVFIHAFGHRVSFDGLLVAFCLANVLAAIPITPGGLGIIEGVLTPTLVGFGTPAGIAALAVVSWRLVNFWLPIPAGGLAYVSLRLAPDERSGRRAEELGRAVEEADAHSESTLDWAARRGLRVRRRGPAPEPPVAVGE
ncbi:MAG: lysylphosphatidylglycerol synthase transmembrane domain-containing protein [Acidimicrobiales bacterium]